MLRTEAFGCPACPADHHRDGRVKYVHRVVVAQTVAWPEPDDPGQGLAYRTRRRFKQPIQVVYAEVAR